MHAAHVTITSNLLGHNSHGLLHNNSIQKRFFVTSVLHFLPILLLPWIPETLVKRLALESRAGDIRLHITERVTFLPLLHFYCLINNI